MKIIKWLMGLLLIAWFCAALAWEIPYTQMPAGRLVCHAAQDGSGLTDIAGAELGAGSLAEFDDAEIQGFLDQIFGKTGGEVSFRDMMMRMVKGDFEGVAKDAGNMFSDALFSEIRTNTGLMGQIVILALIGAVFSNFSSIFGSGHVSETGFYVIYLLIMTFLAASFFASIQVADEVFSDILEFMKVLLPAYFMAVAMAGGSFTASALCGFTFAAIGAVQTVFSCLLIPLMRVYMMMVLAGNIWKEDMISRLTELLRQFMMWTVKTMFGLILGFHLIQGMVLPQADALKNASVMRAVAAIPGVGGGANAVSQIVMGSGILIKNTAGAAAVIILILLAAVPLVKLAVLMLLYYVAAAAMQPVCDGRLVNCVSEVAAGHGMLFKMVGYSLALFAVTIAVLCISTNVAYYAG